MGEQLLPRHRRSTHARSSYTEVQQICVQTCVSSFSLFALQFSLSPRPRQPRRMRHTMCPKRSFKNLHRRTCLKLLKCPRRISGRTHSKKHLSNWTRCFKYRKGVKASASITLTKASEESLTK